MATAFAFEPPSSEPKPTPRLSGLRLAPRYAFQAQCQFDFEGIGRVTLPAHDLSAAGIRVLLDVFPEEGTRVRCAVPLPTGEHWLVGGHVVRVIDVAGPACGIAIAFEGVTAHDRKQLAVAFA